MRSRSGGGPGQNDDIGLRGGHLCIGDAFARGYNHISTADSHHLGDPRGRADARVRPCFAINARPLAQPAGAQTDSFKNFGHAQNEALARGFAVRNGRQHANVAFDVGKGPRIDGEKAKGLLEQLRKSFGLEGNRSNHEIRAQAEDLLHGIKVPAVA